MHLNCNVRVCSNAAACLTVVTNIGDKSVVWPQGLFYLDIAHCLEEIAHTKRGPVYGNGSMAISGTK